MEYRADRLGGITVLRGKGWVASADQTMPGQLIPCYAWNHRDISPMAVWLPKE